MNRLMKLNSLRITLLSTTLFCTLAQAPDAQSKAHHHQARQEETSQESAPAAQQEQAQTEEAPAQTSEDQPIPGDGVRHGGARQPVVSLFDIVGQGLGFGLLIILLLAVPLSSTVLLCAIVWHTQKALNGGKKPSIG